jgi:hypothetical protein
LFPKGVVGFFWTKPRSSSGLMSQIAHDTNLDNALYLDSVLEMATTCCFLFIQATTLSIRMKRVKAH